ncbi:MAG TPA: hypothetical protein DFS52_29005 [Myxococcales bacterium]|jgi:hypothetical protein|nr:hypothetical protein [Myxococcales bacterium]
MVDVTRVEIEMDEVGWVLRVINPGMRPQEYRCASKEQAQSLAEVMTGAKVANSLPRTAAKPPGK